jgi:hypothetical protein
LDVGPKIKYVSFEIIYHLAKFGKISTSESHALNFKVEHLNELENQPKLLNGPELPVSGRQRQMTARPGKKGRNFFFILWLFIKKN